MDFQNSNFSDDFHFRKNKKKLSVPFNRSNINVDVNYSDISAVNSELCPVCNGSNLEELKGENLYLSQAKLNEFDVQCMRDPGATISVAKKIYVHPDQLTEKYVSLKLINGYVCNHQLACVYVISN